MDGHHGLILQIPQCQRRAPIRMRPMRRGNRNLRRTDLQEIKPVLPRFAILHTFHQVCLHNLIPACRILDFQLAFRMLRLKLLPKRSKQPHFMQKVCTHADPLLRHLLDVQNPIPDFTALYDKRLALFEQIFPRRRQAHPFLGAKKEGNPKVAFQIIDLLDHGAGRHVKGFCRF